MQYDADRPWYNSLKTIERIMKSSKKCGRWMKMIKSKKYICTV